MKVGGKRRLYIPGPVSASATIMYVSPLKCIEVSCMKLEFDNHTLVYHQDSREPRYIYLTKSFQGKKPDKTISLYH